MWQKLEHHIGEKYELRFNDTVLGTIFHKVNGKWSVWISTPIVVLKVRSLMTDSYQFETLEDAKAAFPDLLNKHCMPWFKAAECFLNQLATEPVHAG